MLRKYMYTAGMSERTFVCQALSWISENEICVSSTSDFWKLSHSRALLSNSVMSLGLRRDPVLRVFYTSRTHEKFQSTPHTSCTISFLPEILTRCIQLHGSFQYQTFHFRLSQQAPLPALHPSTPQLAHIHPRQSDHHSQDRPHCVSS